MSSTMTESPRRWMSSTKRRAGTEVWYGRAPENLPYRKLAALESDVFAAYSGPDEGLLLVQELENQIHDNAKKEGDDCVCGSKTWKEKNRKAYGISTSLYDQHPIKKIISGDPIADAFAICARKNSCVMVIADGVNWGEKSMLAARCAVYGATEHINQQLFGTATAERIRNTRDAFSLLLQSVEAAHKCILKHSGGLTTLCVALILPTRVRSQYVVCIANVGDSLAYVFSKFHGVREITTGSHDIQTERDIRDAGGAIGPVNGNDPELNNLTCSMTYANVGDIVYLTTDGISDNYDPVVTKIAVPKQTKPPEIPETCTSQEREVDVETGDIPAQTGSNITDCNTEANDNVLDTKDAISNDIMQGEGQGGRGAVEAEAPSGVDPRVNSVGKDINTAGDATIDDICDKVQAQEVTERKVLDTKYSSQECIQNSINKNSGEKGIDTETECETTSPKVEDINSVNANVVSDDKADNHNHVLTSESDNVQTPQNMQIRKTQSMRNNRSRSIDVPQKSKSLRCSNVMSSTQGRKRHIEGSIIEGGVVEQVAAVSGEQEEDMAHRIKDGKPEMAPHERHQYAVKEMEKVVLEYELMTEDQVCAQELCGALLHHVLKLTNAKRNVLEDPNLYGKKLRPKDRKRRDSEIVARMSRAPGKLDHATIVGYEVGRYQGDADEDYEKSDAEDDAYGSHEEDSEDACDDADIPAVAEQPHADVTPPVPLSPVAAAIDIPFIDDSEGSEHEE